MTGHPSKPIIERLLANIQINSSGCWLWQGSKYKNGYGRIRGGPANNQKMRLVHRVSYEFFHGPIAPDLEIDHECHTLECQEGTSCVHRVCVNPDHLAAKTLKDNVRRGTKANQTHCINGHKFTNDNTYIRANGTRHCRTCNRIRNNERWAKGETARQKSKLPSKPDP